MSSDIITDPEELAAQRANEKAAAALIARLEASGHAVQKNRSGGSIVNRRGMSRHCLDMESLRDFAKQVGAL